MDTSVTGECSGTVSGVLRKIIVAIHDNDAAAAPFFHALRIALAAKGDIEIVDVREAEIRVNNISVRHYLEQWGVLPPESKRGDVSSAGLRVTKVVKSGNQRQLIKDRLKQHPQDLLVIGTEQGYSTTGVFSKSLAAYLADYFRHSTLFFPVNSRPFVNASTGAVNLKRILMPVERQEFFAPASTMLAALTDIFPQQIFEVTLLHVGTAFPSLVKTVHPRIVWKEMQRQGSVVDTIADQAEVSHADLVLMSTNGRDTLPRKIAGSTTEHLLQKIQCPVLSVAVQTAGH